MFERQVEELNSSWAYKYDIDQYAKREHWQIMKEHPYVGDCEDYALTLLYLISGKSMWKFWFYLSMCENAMGSTLLAHHTHTQFHSLLHTLAGLNEIRPLSVQF